MSRRLPIADVSSAPFWAATRAGRLLLPRGRDGALRWPPPPSASDWVEVSGRGTVWTFSVVHRSSHDAPPVPYVMAVVELEEGPFMFANVIADEVEIGMPVVVAFEELESGEMLPVFRPA